MFSTDIPCDVLKNDYEKMQLLLQAELLKAEQRFDEGAIFPHLRTLGLIGNDLLKLQKEQEDFKKALEKKGDIRSIDWVNYLIKREDVTKETILQRVIRYRP
jgi:hypothetical protein